MRRVVSIVVLGILAVSSLLGLGLANARAQSNTLTFAVIGDFGTNDDIEAAVSSMIAGWNPDLVVGLGDNYYAQVGGVTSQKYDLAVGKYFCNFLKDITTSGTFCPGGLSPANRFFPALGDHDYVDGGSTNGLPTTYTDYFNLPGTGYTSSSNNERYYDFVSGPVHFFILNSWDAAGAEPDGTSSTSVQAQWLQTGLAASTSTWNIVVSPNPPYGSAAIRGSNPYMQWPFAQWGADAVLSGDTHIYDRVHRDGIVYFVNGVGGQTLAALGTPIQGSAFRYNTSNGAQRVTASDTSITFEFYTIDNGSTLRDSYTLYAPGVPTPVPTAAPTTVNVPVSTYVDDAEMNTSDGTMYLSSTSLEMTRDNRFARDQSVGLRFLNIPIPPGSVITNAYIQFEAMSANSETTSLAIQAEAVDDSAPYKYTAYNLSSRPLTTAVVNWDNIPPWTVVGSKQQTPDLTPLLQEVVNRPGWVFGNNLGFVINGTGTRTAVAYDTNPASAPVLHVEFAPPATPTPSPTATLTPVPTDSGWKSPAVQAAIKNIGDGNGFEVTPTNVFTDDSIFAMDVDSGTTTSSNCTDSGKDRHKFYNYNISIPPDAAVQGIELRLDAKADSTVGSPKICASLSWNGGSSWSAWQNTFPLTANEASYTLGGTGDAWGHAWLPTELSNSNFQVRVADVATDNTRDFSLDWIGVRVSFVPASTATPTLTNTPLPPTATPTVTDTPLPPTDTPTPTDTGTPLPPSETPTTTDTPTSTSTATATFTPTPTVTFTATPTFTPVPNSTGWKGPASQSAVINSGDANGYEVTPANAFASDGLFAMDADSGTTTSTSCTDAGKDRHRFYNYGISIPGDAAVQGIEVRLDARADSTAGAPRVCVSISKDNGSTWSAWKNSAALTTTQASYVVGSPSDLWGLTWTSANLANGSFQVRVADVASDTTRDFSLDWIAVNVTYAGGSTATPTLTSTPTNTATNTPVPTFTFTPTDTPTPAPTFTATSTSTPTATFTPTPTSAPVTSTGWQSPGKQTVITTTGDGNGFELNPGNAFANDNLFAMDVDSGTTTSTSCSDTGKDRHKFLNYNMALPAGVTVQGIEVRLDALADSVVGAPKMCVTVSWDGGTTWSAWKNTTTLSTTKATYILGAPSDNWGHIWTTAEVSNIQIRIADVSSDNTRDFSFDWAAVNVTYNP